MDVHIISHHHRRSPMFEEGMQKLYDAGFQSISIQETGNSAWGQYQGPKTSYVNLGCQSYDNAMTVAHSRVNEMPERYMLFLDNDLICTGAEGMKNLVEWASAGDYDFVCPFVEGHTQGTYQFDTPIIPVPEVNFTIDPNHPDIPSPNPHFHSTPFLVSRRLWTQLTGHEVNHHRRLIYAAYNKGAKIGALHVDFKTVVAFGRDDWFHIGSFAGWYYEVEGQIPCNWTSQGEFGCVKAGYFVAQERRYGQNIYPNRFRSVLTSLIAQLGGEEKVLEAWVNWTKDTSIGTLND